jgi:uncharacterized membrane protein
MNAEQENTDERFTKEDLSDLAARLESSALSEVEAGTAGAEFLVLATFSNLVIWEWPVSAKLQKVVNLIVAKSLLRGKLPAQKKSRPKGKGIDGELVAKKYLKMRSAGVKYDAAAQQLAETFSKDARQIMRLVEQHRPQVEAMKLLQQFSEPFPELLELLNEMRALKIKARRHRISLDENKLKIQESSMTAGLDDRISAVLKG